MGQYTLLVDIEEEAETPPHKITVSCKCLDDLVTFLKNSFLLNYHVGISLYDDDFEAYVSLDRMEQLKYAKKSHGKPKIKIKKKAWANTLNVTEAILKMREAQVGVPVKTRKIRLKTYPNCFVASDAVDWLVKNFKLSRFEALAVAQKLLDHRFIHHVSYSTTIFEDKSVLFKFQALGNGNMELGPELEKINYSVILADMFKSGTGINLKSRKRGRKKYANTFLGNEAVEWLSKKFNVVRPVALCVGSKMMEQRFFHPINVKVFADEPFLYTIEKSEMVDLDFPAERVLQVLTKLRNEGVFQDQDERRDLDFVISSLAQGNKNLYCPKLEMDLEEADEATRSLLLFHGVTSDTSQHPHHQAPTASPPRHDVASDVKLSQPHLDRLLPIVGDWQFDIFNFASSIDNTPLIYVGFAIFHNLGLIERFNIDEQKLKNFLVRVEMGYHADNPYHNNIHATDVTQAAHSFLVKGELDQLITPNDTLALIIACLIHDFDHPGFNNAFLVNTNDPKAIRYNDRSVLENHHCSAAFDIILTDSCNILSELPVEQFREVRETVIQLVLATDFSKHFDILGRFKSRKAAGISYHDSLEDRRLLLHIAIKCADVSHTSRNHDLHINWTNRITEEFFHQGDEEKKRDLAISPSMDRETTNLAKSQVGFINFLVLPLFRAFVDELEAIEPVVQQLEQNLAYWTENQ